MIDSLPFVLNDLSSMAKPWPSLSLSVTDCSTLHRHFRVSLPVCFWEMTIPDSVKLTAPLGRLYSSETVTAFANWCENGPLVHLLQWIRSGPQRYHMSGHIHVISLQSNPVSEGWQRWMGCRNMVFSPVMSNICCTLTHRHNCFSSWLISSFFLYYYCFFVGMFYTFSPICFIFRSISSANSKH